MSNNLNFGNKVVFLNQSAVSLPSMATDPGSAINGDMYYNTTLNNVRVYEGGTWLSLSSSVSAATPALDNLTSTAVNANITPNADLSIDLGSQSKRYNNVFVSSIVNDGLSNTIELSAGATAITNGAGAGGAGFLQIYDGSNTNYLGLKSPTTLTGNTTWILPATDGSVGEALLTDGSGNLSWGVAGSGANTSLNNLASVAINTSLIPATDLGINIGSTSKRINIGYLGELKDASDILTIDNTNRTLADVNGSTIIDFSGTSLNLKVDSNSGLAREFRLFDNSNSHYIGLKSSSSVTSYSLVLPNAQGTSGQTLVNDGSGNLSWATGGGGISWSTPVNADIVPDVTVSRNLGAASKDFQYLYIEHIVNSVDMTSINLNSGGNLVDASGNDAFDWTSRFLYDTTSHISIEISSRSLIDTTGSTAALTWGNSRQLINSAGIKSVDWDICESYDTSGIISIEWDQRKLHDSSNIISTDYSSRWLLHSDGSHTVDWSAQTLYSTSAGDIAVDWNNGILANSGTNSINWFTRQLIDTSNQAVVDWNTSGTIFLYSPTVLVNLSTDPGSAVAGMIYYNTSLNKIKVFNGSTWEVVTSV